MNNPKTQRLLARVVHLLAAGVLGTATYGPMEIALWLRTISQFAVFPMLAMTGIWLWQGHRIRQWTQSARTSR